MTDEQKQKRYETEWSFSFDNISDSINKALGSLSDEIKHENFAVAKENVTAARVVIGGSVGRTTVKALEDSANLFEAELVHMGDLEFTVVGEAEKTITLRQRHDKDLMTPVRRVLAQLGKREELYTNIGISPDARIQLELNGGVGPSEFDLAKLNLVGLNVDGGVGPTTLKLPTTETPYKVTLDGGVGGMTIYTPSKTPVQLEVEGGVGALTIHVPGEASLNIHIEGGVGGTAINVAPGVALRIEAEGGLGGLSVPKWLKTIKSGEDFVTKSGIWESEGYALASRKVTIVYEGGVGGFRVTQQEVQIV